MSKPLTPNRSNESPDRRVGTASRAPNRPETTQSRLNASSSSAEFTSTAGSTALTTTTSSSISASSNSNNNNNNGQPTDPTRQIVQSHLDELQKKYRALDLARKLYADDSGNSLRMQKQQIDKLKKDNERLKDELAVETRQAKLANNLSTSAQIAKLQEQADMYQRKIQAEQERAKALEQQIENLQADIKAKSGTAATNSSRDDAVNVQKRIRLLENQLDKALVKYNQAIAQNEKLRNTIIALRLERGRFEKMFNSLQEELNQKKQQMERIMRESHSAFMARQQAREQMSQLKSQAEQEQKSFEEEWEQLAQLIEQDKKVREINRGGSGVGGGPAMSEKTPSGSLVKGSTLQQEEEKLKKRLTKGAWGLARDKANIHLSMAKMQSYEEAFAKIQKATGIKDVDDLVKAFLQAEDENFSQFNYSNDLSAQIEKLEEQVQELQADVSRYKGTGQGTDNQRKKILQDLEAKLKKTEAKAKVYEERYQQASKTVGALKAGIESLFTKIGANSSATAELLGNAGVTESNMMQYLGIIEQRTNQLLEAYQQQQQGSAPSQ